MQPTDALDCKNSVTGHELTRGIPLKIKSEPLVTIETETEVDIAVYQEYSTCRDKDIYNNVDYGDEMAKIKVELSQTPDSTTVSVAAQCQTNNTWFHLKSENAVDLDRIKREPQPVSDDAESLLTTTALSFQREINSSSNVKSECGQTVTDETKINKFESVQNNIKIISPYQVKVEIAEDEEDATDYHTDSQITDGVSEKDKHVYNLKSLLECTNANLIRSHEDVGYTCYFCDEHFQNTSELKAHCERSHSVIDERDFSKMYVSGFVGKMDITHLNCKLCGHNFDNLEKTILHLNEVHRKNLFTDIKNQIIPFKFDTDILKCCVCLKDFNKFRSLQAHVQTHYKNYECEECNSGFINRMKLVIHLQAHKVGNFTCKHCPKQFNTEFKKKKHESNVHDQTLKVKCGLCNERFKYPRQKELHLTKVHNADPTNKCHLCDKVFVTQDTLSVHVKRDHLKSRTARCTQCDMCFFSPSQLRVHMVKHTGIPQFECEVCHKSYRRKNYYYEHMRIHTNERRHKCTRCGAAFVHKTSLRHHWRATHGQDYAPE